MAFALNAELLLAQLFFPSYSGHVERLVSCKFVVKQVSSKEKILKDCKTSNDVIKGWVALKSKSKFQICYFEI